MVIIDGWAGRLHIDERLMEELACIRQNVKPHNILLVGTPDRPRRRERGPSSSKLR